MEMEKIGARIHRRFSTRSHIVYSQTLLLQIPWLVMGNFMVLKIKVFLLGVFKMRFFLIKLCLYILQSGAGTNILKSNVIQVLVKRNRGQFSE